MKIITILAAAMLCTSIARGADIDAGTGQLSAKVIEHPTKRMLALEAKYGMHPICTIPRTGKSDLWGFAYTSETLHFKAFPVTFPADASDKDIEVAIISASSAAQFYEIEIRQESKQQSLIIE